MAVPIRDTAAGLDLSPRIFQSTTVAASPALAAETTIATLTATGDIAAVAGVLLFGFAAFTVGASGSAVNVRIRKTTIAGTVVVASGLVNATAGNLSERQVIGFDASPTLPGQVYLLTMIVTAGGAESTVSACTLAAIVI
jgi:hypothetical protein